MLEKHCAPITKEAFNLACQKEELLTLKLLVKHARKNSKNKDNIDVDPELGEAMPMVPVSDSNEERSSWYLRLFHKENKYVKELLKKDSSISEYLKRVHKAEIGTVYSPGSVYATDDPIDDTEEEISLEVVKALFELQQESEQPLEDRMKVNAALNLSKNIELLILNHKGAFNKLEILSDLLKTLIKKENMSTITFIFNQYLTVLKDQQFLLELFHDAVENSNTAMTKFLVQKFPELGEDQRLFEQSASEKVATIIEESPGLFTEPVLRKDVVRAFMTTVEASDKTKMSFYLENFPLHRNQTKDFNERCADNIHNFETMAFLIEKFPSLSGNQLEIKVFAKVAAREDIKEAKIFLDMYPYMVEDYTIFDKCDCPAISFVLKNFSHTFKASAGIEEDLAKALIDSNKDVVLSYLQTFPILAQQKVAVKIFECVIQHCEIDMVYLILDELPNLKKSKDELIQFLLSAKLNDTNASTPDDINKSLDNTSKTALHLASQRGYKKLVGLLCIEGANLEVKESTYGMTPLHVAASKGEHEIVDLLVENGAQIDVRDQWSCTPLHYAAQEGYFKVAQILVNHGADTEAIERQGRTPLREARASSRREYKKVISLLEKN